MKAERQQKEAFPRAIQYEKRIGRIWWIIGLMRLSRQNY